MDDPALVLAVREWRYGPRNGRGHLPEVNDRQVCIARGPDGKICGRAANWYEPVAGTPRWRHNPRPYGRSMRYHRRSCGE